MAEFCIDCLNKYHFENDFKITEKDVTLSMDFCEDCGLYKQCVITIKKRIIINKY